VQRFLEASLSFLANIAHSNIMKSWLGKHAFDLLFELCVRKDLGSTGISLSFSLSLSTTNLTLHVHQVFFEEIPN
jgi:hypothetical protein